MIKRLKTRNYFERLIDLLNLLRTMNFFKHFLWCSKFRRCGLLFIYFLTVYFKHCGLMKRKNIYKFFIFIKLKLLFICSKYPRTLPCQSSLALKKVNFFLILDWIKKLRKGSVLLFVSDGVSYQCFELKR